VKAGKKRRIILLVLVLFVSFVLQTTVIPFLRVGGIMPDLLLILTIFTALFYGSQGGGAVGFTVGLAQDLLVGRHLGIQALSGLLTGYTVGYLEGKVYKKNPLVPLFLVFLGSLFSGAVFLLGRSIIGIFSFTIPLLWYDIIMGALYNTLLGVFLFRPFARLVARPEPPGVDPVHMYVDYRG